MSQRSYPEHPVPPYARDFPHIASYFASEGRALVDARWSGDEVAADLSRSLLPWARESVLAYEKPDTSRGAPWLAETLVERAAA